MSYDVLGVGQPLLDNLIQVDEEVLVELGLEKGGSEPLSHLDLEDLIQRTVVAVKERTGRNPKRTCVPGGTTSNLLKGMAIFGEKVALTGKVGRDENAEVFSRDMQDRGVICLTSTSHKPTGHTLCLVTPDGERTMRVYLGAGIRYQATELVPQDFAGCRLVHIEGYTLYNMALCETAMSFGKRAKALVSFDLGSFELVRSFREEIISLIGKYVDIVFCNEEEAHMLTGLEPRDAVKVIAKGCKVAVVTCGAEGCWVYSKSELYQCPAFPVAPVDTTGAGDLFAAGFLHAYLEGYSLEQCARLGALAGAAVVGTLGAEVPSAEMAALKEKINHRAFTCRDAGEASSPTSIGGGASTATRGRPRRSIELGSGAIAIPGRGRS